MVPKTMFQSESDLLIMSLIKDRVFQIYKKHIELSTILNRSRDKFKSKDYIDASVENASVEALFTGCVDLIAEHSKWLAQFSRNLPGFDRLNMDDFQALCASSSLLLLGVKTNPLFINNDNFTIFQNNYQFSRNRMNIILGSFKTGCLFEFHFIYRKLNFTEVEKALFYPFILSSVNSKHFYSFSFFP